MPSERLQKILARAGLGSRRDCDEMIAQGLVTVNGETAVPGQQADATRDQIRVNGARLPKQEPLVYIALNKPYGVISSREAQDERQTVTELVGAAERLYPVGRLDADS